MEPILLYNRRTGALEEETIFEQAVMEFFYGSRLGFWLSEALLKRRLATEVYARTQHSPSSLAKIKTFIENNNINTDELERPVSSFKTFNEFFIRKLKPEARPIDPAPHNLISIADCRLAVYEIKEDTVYPVKAKRFTLAELLDGAIAAELLKKFHGGLCLIFRLAPVDYHRFGYIDDCEQMPVQVINGFYRSVHPLSLRRMKAVFTENRRESCVLKTKNFGEVIHIDVGATGVGRIIQQHQAGGKFQRGEEKGYFEFGGSTVILLLQPNTVKMDDDIAKYAADGIETIVRYGERIGRKIGD
ncbi:MAG: phosphatidylserine decarboxylase [Acidobacteriota bacterium]|nr:phosphatidylserine decarboxylase [Acidobacteriota bacterium]